MIPSEPNVLYPVFVPAQGRNAYRALGAENPAFGATWRAIDQRAAPVSLDLSVSYAPDIFDARDATREQAGTIALGGQRATLQAAVSREMRFLTLRGYATFGYTGRRDIAADGGAEDIRAGAHPDYTVGLQTEARLLPFLALNAGVSAQQSVQYNEQNSDVGTPYSETEKPGGSVSPYAELVVPLLDHRLVGELGYQHDFIGDEKVDEAGSQVGKYYDQGTNLFFTRVLFVFGTR